MSFVPDTANNGVLKWISDLDDVENLRWTDESTCGVEGLELSEYFVEAGHTISKAALDACDRCPVIEQCVTWAANVKEGYFAKLSPGQRKNKTLEELLEIVRTERARVNAAKAAQIEKARSDIS